MMVYQIRSAANAALPWKRHIFSGLLLKGKKLFQCYLIFLHDNHVEKHFLQVLWNLLCKNLHMNEISRYFVTMGKSLIKQMNNSSH